MTEYSVTVRRVMTTKETYTVRIPDGDVPDFDSEVIELIEGLVLHGADDVEGAEVVLVETEEDHDVNSDEVTEILDETNDETILD